MKFLNSLSLVAAIALPVTGLFAEEGMWMPQQIPQLAAKLTALGFQGDPKAFADLTGQPMGAIVSLGGCTASFVSPEGLIVTNHHCVTGGLQFNSTPARNLLKDGFLAKTIGEEIPNAPGSRVSVTDSVIDVTSAITGKIDANATDRQRYDIIEKRIKERVAACEKGGERCTVASFFAGLKYFEIRQMEIKGDSLRARRRNWGVRGRDRQLAMAPAHGRLELCASVRRKRRFARRFFQGQRSL